MLFYYMLYVPIDCIYHKRVQLVSCQRKFGTNRLNNRYNIKKRKRKERKKKEEYVERKVKGNRKA